MKTTSALLCLLVLFGRDSSSWAWLQPQHESHYWRTSTTATTMTTTSHSDSGVEPNNNEKNEMSHDLPKESLLQQQLTKGDDDDIRSLVQSVNYFISRKCNYACKFCFHTQKTSHSLTLEQAKIGLRLLSDAGTLKINFAGGEPFLHPELLGDLCRVASEDLGLAVSIISNGSLITEKWMEEYGRFVDVLGVSVDSFDDETNAAIGRGENSGGGISSSSSSSSKNRHVDRVLKVRDWCSQQDIIFKLNTVVCSLNWQEDMNIPVTQLAPQRWKVFQVLLLQDENMGSAGDIRDARPLVVTSEQFDAFVQRHSAVPQLIPESNSVMQNSYLLLDEDMRFLDCSQGRKVPGESILKVGVHKALQQAGFDHSMFQHRGGVYDWKREKT